MSVDAPVNSACKFPVDDSFLADSLTAVKYGMEEHSVYAPVRQCHNDDLRDSDCDELDGCDSNYRDWNPLWDSRNYLTLSNFFMKPKLVVKPLRLPPEQGLAEIIVRVEKKASRSVKARAFFIQLSNNGRKTAHQVKPIIWVSHQPGNFSIVMIRPALKGIIRVDDPVTVEEFDKGVNSHAVALVHDEGHPSSVTINPKGAGIVFALFFTVEGSNGVFFPSMSHYAIKTPCSFGIAIGFDMRDQPFHIYKVFKVVVRSWESFDVTESKKSDFPFLREAP